MSTSDHGADSTDPSTEPTEPVQAQAQQKYLHLDVACELAQLVARASVTAQDGEHTTLQITEHLRAPEGFAHDRLTVTNGEHLAVGETLFVLLAAESAELTADNGIVLHTTVFERDVTRALAGLASTDPLPSAEQLAALARDADAVVQARARPTSPYDAELAVGKVLYGHLSADEQPATDTGEPVVQVRIDPAASDEPGGPWRFPETTLTDRDDHFMPGVYFLARDGDAWRLLNPVNPARITPLHLRRVLDG